MERHHGKGRGWRRLRCAAAACAVAAVAMVGAATGVVRAASGAELVSYEAVAVAQGVRVSVSAPNFVAVETFVDGGGPVAQAVIDGLGNSQAFASLPYPGDLAISGPSTVAGLTGLPSPPAYPFYVDSSYPTKEEGSLSQPGYELMAKSAAGSSASSATTGGTSGDSAVGSTAARAVAGHDRTAGAVTAEATGGSDLINIGGVLRIGHVDALAKVTRAPGKEPVKTARFSIEGVAIAGQSVGISEKGFTLAGTSTPLPDSSPLLEALEQAQISVRYLSRVDNPDGVVSPGVMVTQKQQIPSGPLVVVRYVFGQMSASATVSGSATSIGSVLPVDTPPAESPVVEEAASPPAAPSGEPQVPVTTEPVPVVSPAEPARDPLSVVPKFDSSLGGTPVPSTGAGADAAVVERGAPQGGDGVQVAAPIAEVPEVEVDTTSVYLVLVAAAAAVLAGGLVLRLVGVRLKWMS